MAYDTRAFGDFGWKFVNAGEKFRKLKISSPEDTLMMCGLFKQATMGDCNCEAPKESNRNELEFKQHQEWLKYKGMDTFEAMQLYIEKVGEFAEIYPEAEGDANAVKHEEGA